MNIYNPNNGSEIPWFEQENVDDFSSVPEKFCEPAISLHERGYCILNDNFMNIYCFGVQSSY